MKNISLEKYIRQSIEDEYAMNVLYHCLKERSLGVDFVNRNIDRFVIDGRFHGEPICISLPSRYKTPCHSLALLLSIRLLMCDKNYIEFCEGDHLIFSPRPEENFQWITFTTLIMDNWTDDEIKMLYCMLESAYFDDELSTKEIQEFRDSIAIPEFRNETLYYRRLSAQTSGVGDEVIGDNAFVDDDIERFVIHKNIQYVGNTVFAFCNKLHTLVFEGKTKFGTFSIIECPNLQQIVVPEEYLDYFKQALPFYKEILCTEEKAVKINEDGPSVGEKEEVLDQIAVHTDKEETAQAPVKTPSEDSKIGCDVVCKKVSEKQEDISIKQEEPAPIDPKILDKVFDKKVTTYKYLWMMAILTLAKERGNLAISFKDLTIRMASFAWPLLLNDEIDFGKSDCMRKYLTDVMKNTTLISSASQKTVETYMQQHYESQGISKILAPLMKNVPYRFLSPWIPFITTEDVVAKSNAKGYNGLYAILEDGILLDEDWWEYIDENYDKIYSFALNSFIDYVSQFNNPMKLIRLKMK